MVVFAAGPRPARRRACTWLVAALPVVLLAFACGSDEAPAGDAAVSANSGGVSTATPIATATATASAVPTQTSAPSVEDLAVASWGEEVCGIADDFALGFLASGDPRDPAALNLQERKDRAETMFPVQLEAVAQAITRLDQTEPPERTADLHSLLRQTYVELETALEAQRDEIRTATSADEIGATNDSVNQLIDLAFRQSALLVNAGYCRTAGQ